MSADLPVVSIGLPTFNGAATLPTTLEFLVSQDFPNLEIVISDNSSLDGTEDVCRTIAATYPHISYERLGRHVSAPKNFALTLARARGAFFMWASDHDRWNRSFVSECVAALRANDHAVLAIPSATWIDEEGRPLEEIPALPDMRGLRQVERTMALIWTLNNCFPVYGMFRTEALRAIFGAGDRYQPGFDACILSDGAAMGEFINVPSATFGLTRRQDFGDGDAQLAKLGMRPRGSKLRSEFRILRFSVGRGISAARLTPKARTKAFLVVSVAAITEYRYRHLLSSY